MDVRFLKPDWIVFLGKQLIKLRKERKEELDRLEAIFGRKPETLIRRYVEPNVQYLNPIEHRGEAPPTFAEPLPLRDAVNNFLNNELEVKDGRHVLFLLGDAGMGKTSVLLMLRLTKLLRFWPSIRDFQLFKLGPETLDQIDKLPNKGQTVLLLDALDEDPEALGPGKLDARLSILVERTRPFRQVLISCRTQFFPRIGSAPIEGRARVNVQAYVCNLLYLSPFIEPQIEAYLKKAYPNRGWWRLMELLGLGDNPNFQRAAELVEKMGDLPMRPLMLSHIHDLMQDPRFGRETTTRGIQWLLYGSLVRMWLLREVRKLKRLEADPPTEEDLRQACRRLAIHMHRNEEQELDRDRLGELLEQQDVKRLTAMHLGGRALLNKTSSGAFRFAHKTVQEFLVVEELGVQLLAGEKVEAVPATDEMIRFYFSSILAEPEFPNLAPHLKIDQIESLGALIWASGDVFPRPAREKWSFAGLDFQDADLRGLDLSGSDLHGLSFSGANLSGVDLSDADFSSVDLSGADLSDADLSRAELEGADLLGAKLDRVRWDGARSGGVPLDLFHWIESGLDGRIPLWRLVPAGEGWIGSPADEQGRVDNEGPRYRLEVVSPFQLAAVPVTNAQYAFFDPKKADDGKPNHPVVGVSWDEAGAFCRWLAKLPGFAGARLPTEEEWEYACRAGTTTRYWSGDAEHDLKRVGWFGEGSKGSTHEVACKPANPWGLYDMHGNVFEWTASLWRGDYSQRVDGSVFDPAEDSADLAADSPRVVRVIRGGCFWDTARRARSAYRVRLDPGDRFGLLGFRVLLPFAPSDS